MQSPSNTTVADAIITIVIPPFTAAWVTPSPDVPTVTVDNCQPQSFIPVLSPPVQNRISIVQPSGSGSNYVPGSITISGSGALTICFKVISGVGSDVVRYIETGLIFGLVNGGGISTDPERTGRDNFPDFVSDDSGITVTNEHKEDCSYEFVLVIQNGLGGVAVVDPRITNTP